MMCKKCNLRRSKKKSNENLQLGLICLTNFAASVPFYNGKLVNKLLYCKTTETCHNFTPKPMFLKQRKTMMIMIVRHKTHV